MIRFLMGFTLGLGLLATAQASASPDTVPYYRKITGAIISSPSQIENFVLETGKLGKCEQATDDDGYVSGYRCTFDKAPEMKMTSKEAQESKWNFTKMNLIMIEVDKDLFIDYVFLGTWERQVGGTTMTLPLKLALSTKQSASKNLSGKLTIGNGTPSAVSAVGE